MRSIRHGLLPINTIPYAHILAFSNIVIAPTETRFDVEDRFYAMRYGTRPGQRKTWRSDTAAITMDFATQGMATKPYGVTRGQIRNTLTHDNMGADPYSEVRFMLSAEDNLGIGRLKVMTYSGMAMGYALGLAFSRRCHDAELLAHQP